MNISLRKNKTEPLLVGLTGGIGSGKSTVAQIFQAFNIKVFNSDYEAKKILNTNKEVREEITEAFGDVYSEERVNTQKLAAIVFENPLLLKQLNNIIHPRVNDRFNEWVRKNNKERILLKEAAILIESGAYKQLDAVILVVAPEELRISRVIQRDSTNKEAVRERIKSQWSDEDKMKYCNYCIKNNEQELIIPQVENILKELNR